MTTAWRSALRYVVLAIAGIAGLTIASVTGLAAYMVSRISRPRRSHRPPGYTLTPWEFQIPYESFEINVNGETIDAWLLPQKNASAPCIVGLSGFASHKGELLGIGTNLFRDGFTVLLIDFRGTGRSAGNVLTMGHNETDDTRAALDWISSRFPDAPIGMIGYSLGGSVALMVAATDQRVRAVVSDSGFATQRSILAHHIRLRTGLWPTPILAAASPMFHSTGCSL
jgi:pimeloyl-ACP methyl ester carboxylesterase